ncbi:RNA-guided endonuclease InsQ/TnpB family protein [Cohnella silvisoli]|uniref:Transposase n=1 Tax=Cohnella silvisoli TaxID=2873699 RepID=A0ABV1KLN0_9BACL|nr:transposase [Cohnella silvisoli]MCD9020650.1 transposase [Cohnella silvisoli]
MQVTLTAKVKLTPTPEQASLLLTTIRSIKQALNHTSRFSFEHQVATPFALHKQLYRPLRTTFGLRSQMAQSVIKTVAAKYRSMKSNGVTGTLAVFRKPEYDLVYNRDYSIKKDQFSLNTLEGRVKVPFNPNGMERFFDGTWDFGTAKLVVKKGKFFLHIPMTKEMEEPTDDRRIRNIVGIDLGINFLATTYDSDRKTAFYNGRQVKTRRARYAQARKSLQQRQTPSARRRLKATGNRENRWMSDVNHQLSKALVTRAGKDSLLVLEDLSGVRGKTEKVRLQDRYVSVSWAFRQLRQMIEYKAALHQCKVIAVDPAYTSQTCPKCLKPDKANRIKKIHTFRCKKCGYTTNDDRVGAMNLRYKGTEYLSK